MILSSKQVLIVSAAQQKELFLFDPKTTAVVHKYRDEVCVMPHHAYLANCQQILAQQEQKTFINVWNWDAQEPEMRISMTETITSMKVTVDGHFLYGGGVSGTIYLWELPAGLLMRKKAVHASAITHILQYRNNHLITASRNELKIWSIASLLIEQDNSPPLKQHNSLLDIVEVAESRNIIAVLTQKHLTLLSGSLSHSQRDLQVLFKVDYEVATAMAISRCSVFVGDGRGNIDVVETLPVEQERDVVFRVKQGTHELDISRPKRKKTLNSSKHPISSLAYIQTLAYLVAGHVSGQVVVWHNQQVKKSLHLFKTSITGLTVIPKPQEHKIHQTTKLRPLNKYEMGKEQEPLEIIPSGPNPDTHREIQSELQQQNEQALILERMLLHLHQPEKLLREQIGSLRGERSQLLAANLHYCNLLLP